MTEITILNDSVFLERFFVAWLSATGVVKMVDRFIFRFVTMAFLESNFHSNIIRNGMTYFNLSCYSRELTHHPRYLTKMARYPFQNNAGTTSICADVEEQFQQVIFRNIFRWSSHGSV